MDVVTAFLNGELQETVYMEPPAGFPEEDNEVLLLQKSIYGLKQSPRAWYDKLRGWLEATGWVISEFDSCVFMHRKRQLWMTVYVDDSNIFGPNEDTIVEFKKEIGQAFKMTDEGEPSYYLRMQVQEDKHTGSTHVWLSGSIQQALNEYDLAHIRPVSTPVDITAKLQKETETTCEPGFRTRYQSKTGKLNYFATKGRPDISFAVSLVCRYNANPNQHHMDAVDRIFAYLKGTINFGTKYTREASQLLGYVDSDFGGCQDTSRSTTGWVFTLGGAPISWCSQRQPTIAHSSAEAEYVAASEACREGIWLKDFLNDLQVNGIDRVESVTLNIDNESAIKMTKNPEFHNRTKHIKRRYHHIREVVESGEIVPQWISTKDNVADILTKPLGRVVFESLRKAMGVVERTEPCEPQGEC